MAGLERRITRLEAQLKFREDEPPPASERKHSNEEIVEIVRMLYEFGMLEKVFAGDEEVIARMRQTAEWATKMKEAAG